MELQVIDKKIYYKDNKSGSNGDSNKSGAANIYKRDDVLGTKMFI